MKHQLIRNVSARIPETRRRQARAVARRLRPLSLGTLRRTTPISNEWGFDRGTPVDRYYIEHFLDAHRADIRGRVVEVRDSRYVERFGTNVERVDVLDINPDNPLATIVADLTVTNALAPNQFNCFVLTQTLQFIYDVQAAAREAYRSLCPEGVMLATVPGISRVAPRYGLESDYWRFTAASCRALFGEVFGADRVDVTSYGNVLTGIAFLTGLATEELQQQELDIHDEYFPVVLAIRAVKRT